MVLDIRTSPFIYYFLSIFDVLALRCIERQSARTLMLNWQIGMGVSALHTMGVLPFPSPLHFLFHPPFPSFPLPFPAPSPLIQLEGLGERRKLEASQRVWAQPGHQTHLGAAAGRTTMPARDAPQRHLANKHAMRVSGSDSYASLFLY